MAFKTFLAATILLVQLSACGTTYIRHSGLHHVKAHSELVLHRKSTKAGLIWRSNDSGKKLHDTTFVFTPGTNFSSPDSADTQLYVIENGDVIWYRNAYWVKKNAYKPAYDKYMHNDIRF